MSSRRARLFAGLMRAGLAGSLALALAVASGCTVRPLYADAALEAGTRAGAPAGLSQAVAIKPADTRQELEVRTHLIFLLYGGQAAPAQTAYTFDLGVTSVSQRGAIVQRTRDSEPTSGIVTMTSLYTITDNATGRIVANGRHAVSSSYDIPRQEFAALRAERDAQNRAARELAEILRHTVAQELERLPAV